jgi:hypothetical protein
VGGQHCKNPGDRTEESKKATLKGRKTNRAPNFPFKNG